MTGRVATVRIGWVPSASTASKFSSYIKLQYCSSAQELRGKSI